MQYQMHWPSEHTVDGRSYDGELHLVHVDCSYKDLEEAKVHAGGVVVVAVLINETAMLATVETSLVSIQIKQTANPELEKIGEALPRIQLQGEQAQTAEVVRVEGLLPQDRDYLTYQGSLTTPGFEEGVVWAVLLQPIAVSPAALAGMRQLCYGGEDSTRVGANCREQQPLGERRVYSYRPIRGQKRSSSLSRNAKVLKKEEVHFSPVTEEERRQVITSPVAVLLYLCICLGDHSSGSEIVQLGHMSCRPLVCNKSV